MFLRVTHLVSPFQCFTLRRLDSYFPLQTGMILCLTIEYCIFITPWKFSLTFDRSVAPGTLPHSATLANKGPSTACLPIAVSLPRLAHPEHGLCSLHNVEPFSRFTLVINLDCKSTIPSGKGLSRPEIGGSPCPRRKRCRAPPV